MNIPAIYDYLVRSRRDLWTALEGASSDVLSRPLLGGERFRCIKDLVFHIADVEDGWIHGDILREPMVQKAIPALSDGGPDFANFELTTLLDYWRRVERSTLAYLSTLTADELQRPVVVSEEPEQMFTVDCLLWHVMIHEMRHAAQICVLLRTQGIQPPSLDLLFYLPSVKST